MSHYKPQLLEDKIFTSDDGAKCDFESDLDTQFGTIKIYRIIPNLKEDLTSEFLNCLEDTIAVLIGDVAQFDMFISFCNSKNIRNIFKSFYTKNSQFYTKIGRFYAKIGRFYTKNCRTIVCKYSLTEKR